MELVEYLRKRNESVRWNFTGAFDITNGGLSVHLTCSSNYETAWTKVVSVKRRNGSNAILQCLRYINEM
jgi:hypothetical protein